MRFDRHASLQKLALLHASTRASRLGTCGCRQSGTHQIEESGVRPLQIRMSNREKLSGHCTARFFTAYESLATLEHPRRKIRRWA